jgi:hypothetical protein
MSCDHQRVVEGQNLHFQAGSTGRNDRICALVLGHLGQDPACG